MANTVPCTNPAHGVQNHIIGSAEAVACQRGIAGAATSSAKVSVTVPSAARRQDGAPEDDIDGMPDEDDENWMDGDSNDDGMTKQPSRNSDLTKLDALAAAEAILESKTDISNEEFNSVYEVFRDGDYEAARDAANDSGMDDVADAITQYLDLPTSGPGSRSSSSDNQPRYSPFGD